MSRDVNKRMHDVKSRSCVQGHAGESKRVSELSEAVVSLETTEILDLRVTSAVVRLAQDRPAPAYAYRRARHPAYSWCVRMRVLADAARATQLLRSSHAHGGLCVASAALRRIRGATLALGAHTD